MKLFLIGANVNKLQEGDIGIIYKYKRNIYSSYTLRINTCID